MEKPVHTETEGLAETTGSGLTVIVTVAVLLHPVPFVPVTVYVVVTVGLAEVLVQVEQDNPVEGNHI